MRTRLLRLFVNFGSLAVWNFCRGLQQSWALHTQHFYIMVNSDDSHQIKHDEIHITQHKASHKRRYLFDSKDTESGLHSWLHCQESSTQSHCSKSDISFVTSLHKNHLHTHSCCLQAVSTLESNVFVYRPETCLHSLLTKLGKITNTICRKDS